MAKTKRTLGDELVEAAQEAAAYARGEMQLSTRVYDPPEVDIAALRRRLGLSRQQFADRFGLDLRAVQDWEQGRRRPERAARVLLKIIEKEPEAVQRALAAE
jgi:putative transcriptional regulator